MKLSNLNSPNSFCILTFGCTFNTGDSKKIQKILLVNGFQESSLESSYNVIINTCAVKHSTEAKIIALIKKLVNIYSEKRFIVTGCLPLIDKKMENIINQLIKPKGFILHTHNISNIIASIKNEIDPLNSSDNFATIRDKSNLDIGFTSYGENAAIIQISEGCNNHCSYCCTTNARGTLVSFNLNNIIIQMTNLVSLGVKEFFLTSQDLGNYNYKGRKLHDLLFAISNIEGEFFIRLGMLNPDYIVKNLEVFKTIFEDSRFYRFLHIPIQSASREILEKMRRNYTIDQVEFIIKEFRRFDSLFTFGTDIIVGFPSEENKDYEETRNFISKWKPQVLNISKFTSRPNTDAKRMKQLPSQVVKQRSQDLSLLYSSYSGKENNNWINWEGRVFINEYKENLEYPFMGRNQYYIPILCKKAKLGSNVKLKITGSINHSLIGN